MTLCAELLMGVMCEACEQAVCTTAQTARLVKTNEGSVFVTPALASALLSAALIHLHLLHFRQQGREQRGMGAESVDWDEE